MADTCDRLTAANPNLDVAWDDLTSAGLIDNANVAILKLEGNCLEAEGSR